MAFETLKASIYALLGEISKAPDDLHEMQESLREQLAELGAMGQPLPEDLVALECYLEELLERPERRDAARAADLLEQARAAQNAPDVARRHPRPHSGKG